MNAASGMLLRMGLEGDLLGAGDIQKEVLKWPREGGRGRDGDKMEMLGRASWEVSLGEVRENRTSLMPEKTTLCRNSKLKIEE